MPNQLAQSKKRLTFAEHSAVLAALETLAKSENLTVTDLLRRLARRLIAERSGDPILRKKMRLAADMHAPQTPEVFRTPAKLAKFKREQRQHDHLLQELNLADPDEVQYRNSLVSDPKDIVPPEESLRRADEMHAGAVAAMNEGDFFEKVNRLRGSLRQV